MNKDMTRLLIESTVRRALLRADSPAREARNLIDLGLNFSSGRFQKRLFSIAQAMLCDEHSAYYTLIRDMLAHVDRDRLLTFGVNLGYEGCTKGARIIRAVEAAEGFNIPWALSLALDAQRCRSAPEAYPAVLDEARALGVHTFLLACGDALCFAPLLRAADDCAFALFVRAEQVTDAFLDSLEAAPNALVCVQTGDGDADACARLRARRYPYAVWTRYSETPAVTGGQWLRHALALHPQFAFLSPAPDCPDARRKDVYEYVLAVRDGQRHPVLLMELQQDLLLIDRFVSDDVCLAAFDEAGRLHSPASAGPGAPCELFRASLREILAAHFPRAAQR